MKQRDAYFDNAKFILIVLVVVGHVIEPLIGPSRSLKTLYLFLYLFHMPLFIFIAGYFSKNIASKDYEKKVISKLVIPYFIFESIYTITDYFLFKREVLTFSYFTPYWVMWFLFSLMIWKVILPYVVQIRYALFFAFALAILIGYATDAGYYASVSRTIVFFPFFLAGYYFDKKHLNHLFKTPFRLLSATVLVIIFVVIYFKGQGISPQWLYSSVSYSALKHTEWYAGVYRIGILLLGVTMSAAFLSLVPRARIPFVSGLGTRTMYAFLIHGLVIKYFATTQLYQLVQGPFEKIGLILLGFLIAVVLTLPVVSMALKYIVEPNVKHMLK